MTLPPVPEAVIELLRCGCISSKCVTKRYKCVINGLECTELCACWDADGKNCLNNSSVLEIESDSDNNTDLSN